MKPVIYLGTTRHARSVPERYLFSYPLFEFACDVSRLGEAQIGRLFCYNRWGVFGLYDRDYLMASPEPIERKAHALLMRHGLATPPHAVILLTMPRFFGYVFNPVSFYLVKSSPDTVSHVMAEVNNTFGEKHVYCLEVATGMGFPIVVKFPKQFFVSPFFDVAGEYELSIREWGEKLEIHVALIKDGREVFQADLRGTAQPLSTRTILLILLKYPLTGFLTMTRIHLHALKLYLRGLVPYTKPAPSDESTVRSCLSWIHRMRLRGIEWMQNRNRSIKS